MQKLKIGILGTRGIPNHYGGFEQFAEYLSLGLVQRGHEVCVYNSSRHHYQQNEWNGIQIIHCTDPEAKLGTFGQFIYDLNCINDSRKRNFDVLLHLGYTSDSIWHWRWPKNTINMLNVDGMEWMRSKFNKPTKRFLKFAEALAAKNAQVLIADSPQMQQHFWNNYGRKPAYIPYGADIFSQPNPDILLQYKLAAQQYHLLVARLEPENNIEMIINGFLRSRRHYPLLIVGNTNNKFGKHLDKKFNNRGIKFIGSIYDQYVLNNLRYFSGRYFHGHSVGGTNPSLLEAMACGCNIAAHNNVFNKSVLQTAADYFLNEREVTNILDSPGNPVTLNERKRSNMEKIRKVYNIEKNIDEYEQLMMQACGEKRMIIKPSPVSSL